MNNRELKNIEEAYYIFLRQVNRKKIVNVEYHRFRSSKGVFDTAFIGYKTANGGLYGIHYNSQYHSYSFGTKGGGGSWRALLTAPQVGKIPSKLKDAFKEVVNKRKDTIIK